ncbi:methionine adenosyltransferase 2 subunit beta [Patella vulgata]|uniref:methionine adenosyltransferase 2 subunit beta n=1 Tax=Patella vulgata TaxID=6465 RepID=UPI00217FCF30|nr:methionine adenosyltransferase 2 subunit beta [Patella vulgata]
MSKKVLITGASGLLGRAIYQEFKKDSTWDVLGLAFSRAGEQLKKVDLTNSDELTRVVKEFQPNVIIHSAAERRPDVVENQADATKQLNVDATRNICNVGASVNAWVLFISTDYVFDGLNPPYDVNAVPNPLNKYGLSKYEGEKVTLASSSENSVLRVPILYGPVERLDESAVTVLFPKVKNTDSKCVMSNYERRYPTYCPDIAVVIRNLSDIRLKNKDVKGIYHWSGEENMTKCDMAIAMAECFGISTNHIEADNSASPGAPRPYDAHLVTSRLDDLVLVPRSPFKDSILKVLKDYYP